VVLAFSVVRRALLGLSALLVTLACGREDSTPRPADRSAAGLTAAGVRLALVATRPGDSESRVHLAVPGEKGPPAPVASVSHVPDGEVRGATLPGGRFALVADSERRTDPSFGAWLLLATPGQPSQTLAKGCVHASRPVVTSKGTVLVQRGSAGPPPDPAGAELRTDALEVSEVDPTNGSVRTVHAFSGYITHIAGVLDAEVYLYRVAHQWADVVGVDIASGALRVLAAPVEAKARDFTVDPASRSLVYANHDQNGWLVERLSLETGARQEIGRADGMWVTPGAWPGGGVLVNDGRGAEVRGGTGPSRPLGPGFDELRAVSADGAWVALLHRVPSALSTPFVARADGTEVLAVPAPPGARIDIAGFAP
jgi:hypothetical protein